MSDYDFKSLNDKEFEILCCDLLGEVEGHRIERFKPGKDAGVDGRFFSYAAAEVILQCKHWCNTPLHQLIHALRTKEKPKLDKLKPHRYVLAVSNALSRADKKSISRALEPYIKSDSDIYGKEDLNDLLKSSSHIEKKHYKLWLHSTAVLGYIFNKAILGRSGFSLEEIIRFSSRYVVTTNHEAALKTLERLGVVIITGEPGVGKTTLADHLCLHYVAHGFEYLKISDDIREAESVFEQETKQVIYFDDFLGRNYLDALRGNEGSIIAHFIRRVAANKNKRFILTSRSTILNQGKLLIDSLEHVNIERNEYELTIQRFTELDKAQILYNHIWYSGLNAEYIDQIYFNKRYRAIISHKNFNPRLISYITDSTRIDSCEPSDYWDYIDRSLRNPSQVWDNPFIAQQDDFGRAIVFLVVLHGGAIPENILAHGYHRYVGLPENQSLHGRRDFQSNIRQLTGSFLNRTVSVSGISAIDLFNPSIGDYVLARYCGDEVSLRLGILCLRTRHSLITLRSLKYGSRISEESVYAICSSIVKSVLESDFDGFSSEYVTELLYLLMRSSKSECVDESVITSVALFLLNNELGEAIEEALSIFLWGIEKDALNPEQVIEFVEKNIEMIWSDDEILATSGLLDLIPETTFRKKECVSALKEQVIIIASDNLAEFVDISDAFGEVGYGDVEQAVERLETLVERRLDDLGVSVTSSDVERIVGSVDVSDELCRYFEKFEYEYDGSLDADAPVALAIDEIDDLFDRE